MKEFFIGLIIGMVGGAIAGVLFAPASGKDTRKKLMEKGKDIKEDVSEKVSSLGKFAKEKSEAIIEDAVNEYAYKENLSDRERKDLQMKVKGLIV